MKAEKGINRVISFLNRIEPLLRLIEVVIVGFGTVFVSVKANEIAEMQLDVDKASLQPEFEIVETIENSDFGEENVNSVLTVSNVKGICRNIDIETICILELNYLDNMSPVSKKFKLEDFYFNRIWTGENSDIICIAKNEYNWEKYCVFSKEVLHSEKLDCGFTNIFKYLKVSYVDQLDNRHIKYYKVNGIYTELLSEDEGLARFKEYDDIEDSLLLDQLNLDKLLEDVK